MEKVNKLIGDDIGNCHHRICTYYTVSFVEINDEREIIQKHCQLVEGKIFSPLLDESSSIQYIYFK